MAAVAAKIEIPPGAENYETQGSIPVPFDAKLLSFMPHMHVRGKAYRYELKAPNGEIQPLLNVPRYDFNWQLQYLLREPVNAVAGSHIVGTAWYDNSSKNPANPDPTQTVKWGEQTEDEMMLGYFEFYVPSVEASSKPPNLIEMALRDGGLVFNGMDKNRDGVLTIDESPTAEAFKAADTNANGSVTREEFRVIWQKGSQQPPPKK